MKKQASVDREEKMSDQADFERYIRQMRFAPLGPEGQARLSKTKIVVAGCGALGSFISVLCVRAGFGSVRLIDRDVVDLNNLHRQVIYTEEDAHNALPKSEAARRHLTKVNSQVYIEAVVADISPNNVERLTEGVDLVLDGLDNMETRYIINDACVKAGIPYIYGGAIGAFSLAAAFTPNGPCLRCIWPAPPAPGDLPTCDTMGVINTAPAQAASWQVTEALRLTCGLPARNRLWSMDLWEGAFAEIRISKNPDCPTCGKRQFDFLNATQASWAISLCGRNTVQISQPISVNMDLEALRDRLKTLGPTLFTGFYLETTLENHLVRIFPDGRIMISGTCDVAEAREIAAKYIGM